MTGRTRRALIASGAGRYADAWHPFPRTSALLDRLLVQAGFSVELTEVDTAMTRLDDVELLVVNAGDPGLPEPDGRSAVERLASDGFAAALERGIGVLALHAAVASLRDYPDWSAALGAVWVPDTSWHPPLDSFTVRGAQWPDGTVLDDFEVVDERYAGLRPTGVREVIAHHVVDGHEEPAAWVRRHGGSRIAVDVLGHDERSYASAGHRDLITRLAHWAVAR